MKRTISLVLIMMSILLVTVFQLNAVELTIRPEKTSIIVSPEDKRDTRIFVYYNLPKELLAPGVEINWAIIEFEAEISSADAGMIDVLPVATDWKGGVDISWESPWTDSGGDYAEGFHGTSVTLRNSDGLKKISSNVTMMVKAWLDGYLVNNGIMIVPAEDDLELLPITYNIELKDIVLRIHYSKK